MAQVGEGGTRHEPHTTGANKPPAWRMRSGSSFLCIPTPLFPSSPPRPGGDHKPALAGRGVTREVISSDDV